jgi:hypothetical protein
VLVLEFLLTLVGLATAETAAQVILDHYLLLVAVITVGGILQIMPILAEAVVVVQTVQLTEVVQGVLAAWELLAKGFLAVAEYVLTTTAKIHTTVVVVAEQVDRDGLVKTKINNRQHTAVRALLAIY